MVSMGAAVSGWRAVKPLGIAQAIKADDVHRAAQVWRKERDLQAEVAEILELGLPHDCFWTAIPGGDGRETRAPGYRSGTPDLLFVYRGKILFIELKRPRKGRTSDTQAAVHRQIETAGGAVHVARAVDQVVDLIRDELQCPVIVRV
jgi:hypothetical protein